MSAAVILPDYRKKKLALRDGVEMPYLELGRGGPEIVLIPGAGDGLSTAHDAARGLAWFYRRRAGRFPMLVLSRRERIPPRYAVERHAENYIEAIERLTRGPVILECNSAGGPIGQIIAAWRPDLVRGLVLASTSHRMDDRARTVIRYWLDLIEHRKWGEFGWDTSVKTYRSLSRIRRLKFLIKPFLRAFTKPRDPERMENLLLGLLDADNSELLPSISAPTLVFGGKEDPIFGAGIQREMADLIPGSRLALASGYLHGADLESPRYPEEFGQFVAGLKREER